MVDSIDADVDALHGKLNDLDADLARVETKVDDLSEYIFDLIQFYFIKRLK